MDLVSKLKRFWETNYGWTTQSASSPEWKPRTASEWLSYRHIGEKTVDQLKEQGMVIPQTQEEKVMETAKFYQNDPKEVQKSIDECLDSIHRLTAVKRRAAKQIANRRSEIKKLELLKSSLSKLSQ